MTLESTTPTDPRIFADLVPLLAAATGESERWAASVTPVARLDGDLRLDSIELAAFADAMHERFGVDLAAYLAGLDVDQLVELTVGDLARLVAETPA